MKAPANIRLWTPEGPKVLSLNTSPIDAEWSTTALGGSAKTPVAIRLSSQGEPRQQNAQTLRSYLSMDRRPVYLERMPSRLDCYQTTGKPRRVVDVRLIAAVEKLFENESPVLWHRIEDARTLDGGGADCTHLLVATQWDVDSNEHRPVALVACLSKAP